MRPSIIFGDFCEVESILLQSGERYTRLMVQLYRIFNNGVPHYCLTDLSGARCTDGSVSIAEGPAHDEDSLLRLDHVWIISRVAPFTVQFVYVECATPNPCWRGNPRTASRTTLCIAMFPFITYMFCGVLDVELYATSCLVVESAVRSFSWVNHLLLLATSTSTNE